MEKLGGDITAVDLGNNNKRDIEDLVEEFREGNIPKIEENAKYKEIEN